MVDLKERLADYGLTLEPDVVICDRRAVDKAVSRIAELEAEVERLTGELDDAHMVKREAIAGWRDAEALSRTGAVKEIETVKYVCGQWEKNQGASSLTIAVRALLSALEPAASEGRQDDGHTDADGYPYEFTRPLEQAVTEALERIRNYADKPHADRYVIRDMAEKALKAAMEARG